MPHILITGGAGYIGSHAVRELVRQGYKVTVVDNLSKGYKAAVDKTAAFFEIDLADTVALEKLFSENRFDAVMHFAGSIEVGLSMVDPALFFRNNVLYGLHLLEAMRKANVKNIIFSSTAAVYGDPVEIPIREESPTCPTNFYGQSKLMFEELLQKYEQLFGFHFVTLRYFNACGADMSGEIGQAYTPDTHLIPFTLKTALGQYETLKINGDDYPTFDGTCIRDYIHVSDLVDAHILALNYLLKTKKSEVFNLGNGNGFSVQQVIAEAEKVVGKKIAVEVKGRRAGDPAILIADASKAKKLLGWQPTRSDLQTILTSAWKWYRSQGTFI